MIEKKLQKWPSSKSRMAWYKKPSQTVKAYKAESYWGSIPIAPYKMSKSSTKMRDEMVKAQMKAFKKKKK